MLMMNVLNIPKQCDHRLKFSPHALMRAKERDVPLPKYLPFNTKCVETRLVNGNLRYKLSYTFNGVEYILVVSMNKKVITVYPFDEPTENEMTSSAIAKLRARIDPGFIVSENYICLDYETDYYLQYQCH
jgi:hypothetical protein